MFVSYSRRSLNDWVRIVVLEDVATNVTERIVAEFIALTPRAEHRRNDVSNLCIIWYTALLFAYVPWNRLHTSLFAEIGSTKYEMR